MQSWAQALKALYESFQRDYCYDMYIVLLNNSYLTAGKSSNMTDTCGNTRRSFTQTHVMAHHDMYTSWHVWYDL